MVGGRSVYGPLFKQKIMRPVHFLIGKRGKPFDIQAHRMVGI